MADSKETVADGMAHEANAWRNFILMDPKVRARWDAMNTNGVEFSADDAAVLAGSLIEEIAEKEATIEALKAEVARLRKEVASWEGYSASVNEALNRGDGSYRP